MDEETAPKAMEGETCIGKEKDDVLYEYHRLDDKNKIRARWNRCHILLLAICLIFSFIAFFFISAIIKFFDDVCVFYPKKIAFMPVEQNVTEGELPELKIDFINSSFANKSKCFLPYFFPVLSIIFSIIWITLFIMFKGLKRGWRIVIPGLVFMVAFCLFCFIFQAKHLSGATQFETRFMNASLEAGVEDHKSVKEIMSFMELYIYSIWLVKLFWTLSAFLLLYRLISAPDFSYTLVQVQLIKISPEDVPLLSKPGDSVTQILVPVGKKTILSVISPCSEKTQKIKTILDDGKRSGGSGNEPKVIINPLVVTVDVETGRNQLEAIAMESPSPESTSSQSCDSKTLPIGEVVSLISTMEDESPIVYEDAMSSPFFGRSDVSIPDNALKEESKESKESKGEEKRDDNSENGNDEFKEAKDGSKL